MICQECGAKPAKLHFTKIIQGEKTEIHLCESCAVEKGDGFTIHSLLSGLIDFQSPSQGLSNPPKMMRCEHCGLTYNQFSKLGRFGCANCYRVFDEKLDPLFRKVHSNTAHAGKIPRRSGTQLQQKRELEELRSDLRRRIEHEDFEGAAQVRDRIRQLESEGSAS